MSLSFTLTPKSGMFATKPTIEELKKQFVTALQIGGRGIYDSFTPFAGTPRPENEAEYMLCGLAGVKKGRGFFLTVKKDFAQYEITVPTPTTRQDLENAFTFASTFAKWMGIKTLVHSSGDSVSGEALYTIFPDVLSQNNDLIKTCALKQPGFAVSTLLMPLQMPEKLCSRMAAVPPENSEIFFSSYLAQQQIAGYAYLAPQTKPGQAAAGYILTDDENFIVQKQPFLPQIYPQYGEKPAADAMVTLQSASVGRLGSVPYDVFKSYLDGRELAEFDEWHWLLPSLSIKQLQDIIELEKQI